MVFFVSVKMYIGINVEVRGILEGVDVIGLKEFGVIDVDEFMEKIGKVFVEEFNKVKRDSFKVRWV